LTRGRRALAVGALAVLFAGAGFLSYERWLGGGQPDSGRTGTRLLAASLLGLDGKVHPLAQWRGKVLVANFWATWCAPCREEIPVFIRFQDKYRERGLQFIGIAIDQSERVRPYAHDLGINYPVLVGGLETMEFARQIGDGAGVLPFTVVLDRSGQVVTTHIGALRPETLEKLIIPLL